MDANRIQYDEIAKVADDIIESSSSLMRELPRDFDQLSDIGYALWAVLLRHHNDIEVRRADDILKNLGGGGRVAAHDPAGEDSLEGHQRTRLFDQLIKSHSK